MDDMKTTSEEFKRLKRRDRRVLKAGELTDEELSVIEKSEVSPEFNYLNEEIGNRELS